MLNRVLWKSVHESRQSVAWTPSIIKREAGRCRECPGSQVGSQQKGNHPVCFRSGLDYDGKENPDQPVKENTMQCHQGWLVKGMPDNVIHHIEGWWRNPNPRVKTQLETSALWTWGPHHLLEMSDDSSRRVLESYGFNRILILSWHGERGEDITGWEDKQQAACGTLPSPARFAYRVKEGSLLFADELHQDSWLVVSDIPHVIPPAQKKANGVCPKTF